MKKTFLALFLFFAVTKMTKFDGNKVNVLSTTITIIFYYENYKI